MTTPNRSQLIAIYLDDHFAGATAGLALAKRLESANAGSEFGPALNDLREQIEEDRVTLRRLMGELEIEPSRLKPPLALLAERLGRLKPNGRVRGYSPLSRLIELEGIYLGVTGKRRLWLVCSELLSGRSNLDFGALATRAEAQLQLIDELQGRAAALL